MLRLFFQKGDSILASSPWSMLSHLCDTRPRSISNARWSHFNPVSARAVPRPFQHSIPQWNQISKQELRKKNTSAKFFRRTLQSRTTLIVAKKTNLTTLVIRSTNRLMPAHAGGSWLPLKLRKAPRVNVFRAWPQCYTSRRHCFSVTLGPLIGFKNCFTPNKSCLNLVFFYERWQADWVINVRNLVDIEYFEILCW